MGTVEVSHRSAYGRDIFDPVNTTAQLLAEFAKCKTFTREQLTLLKQLGFEVKVTVAGF